MRYSHPASRCQCGLRDRTRSRRGCCRQHRRHPGLEGSAPPDGPSRRCCRRRVRARRSTPFKSPGFFVSILEEKKLRSEKTQVFTENSGFREKIRGFVNFQLTLLLYAFKKIQVFFFKTHGYYFSDQWVVVKVHKKSLP